MMKKNRNDVDHKRIYRMMKENGLLFKVEHKKTSRTIQKKIKPEKPQEVLGIDMT